MMLNEHLNSIVFFQKNIKAINLFLLITAVLSSAYFVFLVTMAGQADTDELWQSRAIPGIVPHKVIKKSVKSYDRILSRRKLFIAQVGISRAKKSDDAVGGQLSELKFSELELLGIVSGARGPQAIINNISGDRSFYCYGGENIEGFIVDQVLPDKVILKKNDQKFELRL